MRIFLPFIKKSIRIDKGEIDKPFSRKGFKIANLEDISNELRFFGMEWYEIYSPALEQEILQAFFDSQNLTTYWREGEKKNSLDLVGVI